ncbi:LamG domain-containing protein [Streptomyces sp. NBC_00287]|uniref:LamG domain-containing protein n=1 Tax=Streptomyces sp. NBC_00287 TaxID=2975702 RepID=UPI002E2E7CE0|nr:LamG domain-containing protein [Streptomyces sp. NBC_00287]
MGLNVNSKPVCETDSSDPLVVSHPRPTLMATAQTMPGGEKDAQLRAYFDIDHKSGSSWVDTPAGSGDLRPSTGYVGDNTKLSMQWAPDLTDGTLYRYRAWVRSYYNGGADHLAGPASASTTGWCYFKVDPSRPKPPQIAIGNPYSECTSNACAEAGGPGVKATFTFSPAPEDTTNVAYQYKLSKEAAWSAAKSGSTVSVDITPQSPGLHQLYVRAKDSITWGAQNVVEFKVATGEDPVAQWHFDEASGTAADAAVGDGADDASLATGAVRHHSGRRGLLTHDSQGLPLEQAVTDQGLLLDGTSAGYASTAGPVLETRSSYTVSAWVRVDPSVTKTVTVLSQTPTSASPWSQKYSPFAISYGSRWSIRAFSTDGAFVREAASTVAHPKGVWTHVAAVHDAQAKKIRLYVNGQMEASVDAGTSWSADGSMQIGRLMWADSYVDHFKGVIDEVTVWQNALTDEQILDESRLKVAESYAGVELVGGWLADKGSGTTVADTVSGYGRTMTLSGGASLNGEEIVLDGVDDSATVAGPLVDGTGSFTVTALAELDSASLVSKEIGYKGQVAGQRTADGSAWGLWFELTDKQTVLDPETLVEKTVPVGFWRFGRLNTDGSFSAVASDEGALLDGMVRLTGVFDAQSGTINLYLGATQNDEPRAFTANVGSGEFAVGRGFTGGVWQHYLPGRVAEVRVWVGAMASSEQLETAVGG